MVEQENRFRTRMVWGGVLTVLLLASVLVSDVRPAEAGELEAGCSKLAWITEDNVHGLDEQVYVVEADGRNKVRVTAPNGRGADSVWEARWLADGRIAGDWRSFVVEADGSNLTYPGGGFDDFVEAPTHDRLAGSLWRSGVTVETYGGSTVTILDEGINWPLTWSPTGEHLVWFGDEGVVLAPADLSTTTTVLPGVRSWTYHGPNSATIDVFAGEKTYAWSPTGSHIALFNDGNIMVTNLNGSVVSTVEGSAPPVWSADGNHIAWLDGDTIRLADKEASEIITLGTGTKVRFSPVGSRVAWISDSAVTMADSDGSNPVVVAAGADKLIWASTGDRVAFVDGQVLRTVAADGSGLVVLDTYARFGGYTGFESAWSPDGSKIQWSSGSLGTWQVANSDGSDQVELSRYRRWGAWSPDSSMLASDQGGVLVVTAADGSGQEYVNNSYPNARMADFIGWSPCVFDVPDPSPANDDFAAAVELSGIAPTVLAGRSVAIEGTTVGAHAQHREPSHSLYTHYAASRYGPYRSVWWKWTPTKDVLVEIDASGSENDTALAVWTGEAVDNLELVIRDNDVEGPMPVQLSAKAGVTYYIALDGTTELEQGAVSFTFGPVEGDLDSCTITGTDGPDVLDGTAGPDVICGLGGDDEIRGFGGADVIFGGDGDDIIKAGGGKDLVIGGNGSDRLIGGSGDDEIYGGDGGDRLYGGKGDDTIYAGRSNDRLFGFTGNDRLFGELGSDLIFGGAGDDLLDGGALVDTCKPGTGTDTVVDC